jgi:hypothetical protein
MQFFYAHPWLPFLAGVWLGVFAGCALGLVLMGSHVQHLEEKKAFLQIALDRRNKARKLRGAMQRQRAA